MAPRAAAAPADPAVAGWKATTKTVQPAPPQITGSIPRGAKTEAPAAGLVIQAGSFKNKDNADRARAVLAAIAPVDVTPVEVGAETYFRVRVGPFSAASEAKAALAKVTGAGYRGAKLVSDQLAPHSGYRVDFCARALDICRCKAVEQRPPQSTPIQVRFSPCTPRALTDGSRSQR